MLFVQKQSSRRAPGFFSYVEVFSSRFITYSSFLITPFLVGLLSTLFRILRKGEQDFIVYFQYFIQIFGIFLFMSLFGAILTLLYSNKAPILAPPPKGWGIQLNVALTFVIGGSYIVGQIVGLVFNNITFHEVFFMLGIIIAYIVGFVIYFSFTTVGKYGRFILSFTQPTVGIGLYSIYTAQLSLGFFIRAVIFFSSCALIFTIFYARGIFHVSNIYREVTGLGGYAFIRAFILSMMTEGHDDKIEEIFDKVGIDTDTKIQYLAIRTIKENKLKGLFVLPHVHFGPFKTCGSSDLPEYIYKTFNDIPGISVYHTSTDHGQNLTKQHYVDILVKQINDDIKTIRGNPNLNWIAEVRDFSRKISNNSKLIGILIDKVPVVFLTRHPLPSDDIKADVGNHIDNLAKENFKFKEMMIIDSHNSIVGDEILIENDSIEAKELINVSKKFLTSMVKEKEMSVNMVYGVAKDPVEEYSEKDGIGYGGMIVHLFKNTVTGQKTALVHFDANNAYVDIRSYVLNALQNRGIERGELTTSDSHTVARQFTSRGYSPLGEKIKLRFIVEKLNDLIKDAEKNMEPVEFLYYDSIVENTRIWGNPKYFDAIIETLQECLRVSQRLLTLSLIVPTFFSLILLMFYYNIQIAGIL
ncbi:MAG: DUF2070 family protein [Candidatus Lokiarchaeota archaeon]|nr:DUF2070 family protein [Candidatus Lokiarchaeota archaeon]